MKAKKSANVITVLRALIQVLAFKKIISSVTAETFMSMLSDN